MWKENTDKDLIIIDPEVRSKKELFEGIASRAYNKDYIINRKQFLKALQDREKMANTELIPGVALPHARNKAVDRLFVCIIIRESGIEYENPEMGPAKIIFCFGCPEEQNKEYLQLLAQSSRLLKNPEFRDMLLQARKPEDVLEILAKFDEKDVGEDVDKKFLLLLTLNDIHKESEALSAMVEAGITNASVMNTTSMARKLAYEMPIFAGLSYLTQGKSRESLVIFSHIRNKRKAGHLVAILKENGIDLNKKGVGFLQLIPVDTIIGDFEEDIEL